MALLGTVLADAVVQLGLGERPMLQLSAIVLPSLGTIPAILSISAVAAFAGLLFNQALVGGVANTPSKVPLWARGVVAGCLVGGCIYFVPMIVLDEQGGVLGSPRGQLFLRYPFLLWVVFLSESCLSPSRVTLRVCRVESSLLC